MKERSPQVILSLGLHVDRTADRFISLEQDIRERLKSDSTLKVIFVQEAYDLTPDVVSLYDKDIKSGIKPSKARRRLKRRLNQSSGLDIYAPEDNFTRAETEMADNLFNAYPNRFSITLESSPKQIIDTARAIKESDRKIFPLFIKGEFDEAVGNFKQAVFSGLSSHKAREERITERIANLTNDPHSLVVVRFGSSHSDIYRLLREKGIDVDRVFDDSVLVNGEYRFTPVDVLERHLKYQTHTLTELEWLQYMIAHAIWGTLKTANPEVKDESITRDTFQYMKFYETMDQIRELEASYKTTN